MLSCQVILKQFYKKQTKIYLEVLVQFLDNLKFLPADTQLRKQHKYINNTPNRSKILC